MHVYVLHVCVCVCVVTDEQVDILAVPERQRLNIERHAQTQTERYEDREIDLYRKKDIKRDRHKHGIPYV